MYNYCGLQGTTELALEIDHDTLKVLRFMEHNMRAGKLCASAELIAKIAPILWGHYDREEIFPVHIYYPDDYYKDKSVGRND